MSLISFRRPRWSLLPPSILKDVLRHASPACTAQAARVCRGWSSTALDVLWGSVSTDVLRAVFLLGVSIFDENGVEKTVAFPFRPSDRDWISFDHNSWRVHRLIVPSIWSTQHIGPNVMRIIQRTSPRLSIFRNLAVLHASLTSLDPILMSENVIDLTIEVDMAPDTRTLAAVDGLIELIIVRMPKISTLTIHNDKKRCPRCDWYAGFGRQFARLISGLSNLERFIHPAEVFTPLMFRALASAPNLRIIRSYLDGKEIHGDIWTLQRLELLPLNLQEAAFPRLRNFEISALSTRGVTRIFQQPSFPYASLVELWLYFILSPETSVDHVEALIEGLVCCNQLQKLVIQYSRRPREGIPTGPIASQGTVLQPFSYDKIRQFLDICSLTVFALDHPLPISMTLAQGFDLAQRCGRFRCLWLSPVPSQRGSDPLPLTVLEHFAENCPDLSRLGIFIRPTKPTDFGFISKSRFSRLEQLFVGSSPLPSAYYTSFEDAYSHWKVAGRALASLLPSRCSLLTLFDIYDMEDDDFFRRLTSEAQWDIFVGVDGWRVVKGLVSILRIDYERTREVLERVAERVQVAESGAVIEEDDGIII